jgi:metal-responsive CopG/Arc/MetJ family transcriptional regulator
MDSPIKKIRVYVRLDDELSERFFRIQEYLGLTSRSEVVRMLINDFWKRRREELSQSGKFAEESRGNARSPDQNREGRA